ncbi:hypothetical protein Tco_0772868 [Tanacetum coccineum]|uniref:Uncharacterized protein n=1 Tax=Tanacetum coccineum TaxID=301880 RepID=A0ABQ4ZM25_9ASTR
MSVPRPDFRSQPKDGRGSNKFTPLTRTPKEIFVAESGKFKPQLPMVTLVEKRISNKFCEFHNDKGHNTEQASSRTSSKKSGKTKTNKRLSFDCVREITFPPLAISKRTKGLLVIEAKIDGHAVHRMYVDGGSSMEIQAVSSMAHEMIKFSVNGGIVTIRNTILTLTESTAIAATPKDTEKKAETRHTNFKVAIHLDFTDQEIAIGGALSAKEQTELYVLLKANLDISVWQPSDMTGVPRSIAKHRLNICDGYRSPTEKYGSRSESRQCGLSERLQKWVGGQDHAVALLPRLVSYPGHGKENMMVARRMCVDFMDLNKACPHDCYPLLELIGRSNPYAAILLSVFWTHTKATIKYRWRKRMKKRRLSIPLRGYIATPKCPSNLMTLWGSPAKWTRLLTTGGSNLEVYVATWLSGAHGNRTTKDIEENVL